MCILLGSCWPFFGNDERTRNANVTCSWYQTDASLGCTACCFVVRLQDHFVAHDLFGLISGRFWKIMSLAAGPVLMLSLEGDNTKRGGVRKYLSVTDFPSEQKFGEGSGDSDERGRCEEQKRPSVEVSNNWEDVEEGEEDEEQRPNRYLDPLWEGLGSLGERLAGVNARFDQLDQEIKHDRDVSVYVHMCHRQPRSHLDDLKRYFGVLSEILCLKRGSTFACSSQVIESYQREAWKEADMASKDLADIRARKLVPAPSNPLLKVRKPAKSVAAGLGCCWSGG